MKFGALEPPRESVAGQPISRAAWFCLAACVVLFLVLRGRWIGHLLVWDEGMALCTARAFVAGADDPFTAWFWRHPPLHSLCLLLLQPLQSGFAERAEMLSIAVGAINQVLLFLINRRVFGTTVGLWSAFLIALLPGSALFDVWIKQDHLVATFGLLALMFLLRGQASISGIFLGAALLTKGTAAFYCLAVFLLWSVAACGKRTFKDLARLVGISALTCSWWYLGVIPRARVPGGADAFQFALNSEALWQSDWSFYFAQLPLHLGWAGLTLALLGVCFVVYGILRARHPAAPERMSLAWPVFLLAPAFLLISFVPNKVPWIVISLFPAWATLGAVTMAAFSSLRLQREGTEVVWLRPASVTALALVLGVASFSSAPRDYYSLLSLIAPGQARGAANSREAAHALNQNVQDSERVLLTSFHYWKGIPPGLPDPVFTYYLTKKPSVLLRSHQCSLADVLSDVREFHLDWALLSPEPGNAANALFGGMEQALGTQAHRTSGAWLFRTAGLKASASGPDTASLDKP